MNIPDMNIPEETTISLPNFKRNNLVEMVFESLKENILNGTLEEDKRLPNQEVLAKQFGVSRTVIREALHKLSSLGSIESHQGPKILPVFLFHSFDDPGLF